MSFRCLGIIDLHAIVFKLVLGSLFSTKEVKSPYENRIGTGRRGHARHVYLRYIGCLFGERH